MGNVGSIANMIKKSGDESEITSDLTKIEKADKLILPGEGAFDSGIENFNKAHLIDVLY